MTVFRVEFPICKINEAERTVEGYATTSALDKQNEIVDYQASKDAFKDFGGAIREMHEPKSIGKAVEWRPDDEKQGIYLKAYISKGAEDTWTKVKEGVLKAFSIGGQTVTKVSEIHKDAETGASKNVTKIMKYRVTEVSLVDNGANPEAGIQLVKMVGDVPTQTEVIEEIKKVLISQSEDTLEAEVKDHRNKADALAKKVLTTEELDKLDSEHWGVIRKYEKDGTKYIERLLPIPDKVHAVRALSVIDSYALTAEEQDRVHEITKSVLGSDYETYAINTSRGGEIKKMKNEILDTLKSLIERMDALEKANMAAPAKEPKTQEEVTTGAPDNSASEKKGNFEADGVTPKLKEASPAKPTLKTQEEGNVAPVKKADEVSAEAKPTMCEKCEKCGKPMDESSQKCPNCGTVAGEKEPVVEKKEIEEAKVKEEMPVKDAPPIAEKEVVATEPEKVVTKPVIKVEEIPAAPVKTVKKLLEPVEEKVSKIASELLLSEIKSLRKRLDAVEAQPLPRKFKVEKNFGNPAQTDASEGLAEAMQKCIELRKQEQNGKKLSAEEKSYIEKTLDSSLEQKFNKNL